MQSTQLRAAAAMMSWRCLLYCAASLSACLQELDAQLLQHCTAGIDCQYLSQRHNHGLENHGLREKHAATNANGLL
jgi:hypothetical protein